MVGVREGELGDAEAIVQLTAAGWRTAYRGIVEPERIAELPISAWRHDVRTGLRSPVADAFTRIAEIDGQIAGYCYVAAPGRDQPEGSPIAELVAIYVAPERWRQGIGRALMESAAAEARRLGYGELILWTFDDNARAKAFYVALGWSPDGAARPHEASGAPTVRLRRVLQQAE